MAPEERDYTLVAIWIQPFLSTNKQHQSTEVVYMLVQQVWEWL